MKATYLKIYISAIVFHSTAC